VWQDADSDGTTDAGEFRSLTAMGITSIALTSNGQGYTAADGDVTVHGEATFTMADGTAGTVADASFAIIEQARQAARTTEFAAIAAATGGLLATTAMVAALPSDLGYRIVGENLQLDSTIAGLADHQALPNGEGLALEAIGEQIIRDPALQIEQAGHDWADGLAQSLSQLDLGALADRMAELGMGDGNAARFDAIADAIGTPFAFGTGSLQAMDALLSPAGGIVDAITTQNLPALETAFEDTAGDHLVDSIVDHFAANDGGLGDWTAPANDFALQGLLDTAIGDTVHMGMSGFDMTRAFQNAELADASNG
jgi:hypothetical protein